MIAPHAPTIPRPARRFDPTRPLDDALLVRLLDQARRTASTFHLQPWRFVVVRDPRNRRRLRACAGGDPRLTDAPVVVIVLAYHHPHRIDLNTVANDAVAQGAWTSAEAAEIKARAPRFVESGEGPAAWSTRWAMAAASTLMIAAEALGVASSPIDTFNPGRLARTFGIPNDHTACLLIPLGYADEVDPRPSPALLPLARIGFEEHFGQPWTLGEPG